MMDKSPGSDFSSLWVTESFKDASTERFTVELDTSRGASDLGEYK
jgi:hypothetical protein